MQSGPEAAPAMVIVIIVLAVAAFFVILLAIMAVVAWFFHRVIVAIPESNRTVQPWMAWCLLVPLFNIVCMFLLALKLPESFQACFAERGQNDGSDYGKTIGLAWAGCATASMIPYVNCLTIIPALVCLILFLVKVNGYRSQLLAAA